MFATPMAKKSAIASCGLVVSPAPTMAAPRPMKPAIVIGPFGASAASQPIATPPTITLFQERTPQRLFGRVVSSRQALTFGAMAISMGAAGYLAGVLGAAEVLMLGGGLIAVAGLGGLLVPAMRGAR